MMISVKQFLTAAGLDVSKLATEKDLEDRGNIELPTLNIEVKRRRTLVLELTNQK